MKIAYFSIEYPPRVFGGLGVYVDSISKEIATLGHEIGVFTLGDGKLRRRQSKSGVTAFRETPVPMKDGWGPFVSDRTKAWGDGIDFLHDLMSYNQLSAFRVLEEGGFDLAVGHDWLGLPGAMAVQKTGLCTIYHVHSTEMGRESSPNPQIVDLEVRGALAADAVITVSLAMKEELASLGVPREKIRVCYHGVDTDTFSPSSVKPRKLQALKEKYGIEDEDPVILFIGRLEPVKGAIPLVRAMPSVLRKHPKAKLLVVGKGTLADQIRREAEPLGESVRVVTDFLDLETKICHYALSDICVFPSLYEPFGIVAVEAASMEKPAVVGANGVSGLREIVDDPSSENPTGVHVDPQNPEDIAWGINLVLEDRDKMIQWGQNARKKCLEIFNWKRAAEETAKIYEEVIASRS